MEQRDRRAYFRLRYPFADRPTVVFGQDEYAVTELSEGGLRFLPKNGSRIPPERRVSGTIRFRDGDAVDIEGISMRESEKEMIIRLFKGVTFNRMMKEQRYIAAKYLGMYAT